MFFQPHDLTEALEIRARLGMDVTPVAGGTDLAVAFNRQSERPRHLLDLTRIDGFTDVRREDGAWVVAGGTTFATIGRLPAPVLAEAAMSVGGPAIRNRGTIAGNMGTASPAGDGCVALLALDAEVELRHATRGPRTIPIGDYFTGFRKTALLGDELITAIRFRNDWAGAWGKIGKRGATNISVVCCAATMSPTGQMRIAFGSVAPTVVRVRRAEAIVEAGGLTDPAIEAAAAAAMAGVSPIDDHRASAAYRRAMCGVLVRRLLKTLRA